MRSGPAHAERGPGADPLLSGAPVPSAAKAAGRAHPKGGQVMLEECGPLGNQGAALTGSRGQGRTWSRRLPGLPTVPAPATHRRGGVLTSGPHRTSGALTSNPMDTTQGEPVYITSHRTKQAGPRPQVGRRRSQAAQGGDPWETPAGFPWGGSREPPTQRREETEA